MPDSPGVQEEGSPPSGSELPLPSDAGLLTGERLLGGLWSSKGRSAGDRRAPSVQTPYACVKEA